MPSLDGLRALAVIAVLLYHADVKWIPGGFLGVDVFFVLSGYLITSLLFAEWRGRRSIDLKTFWTRRARRLLPALFLILATALTFAVLRLPNEVAALRGDAIASAGYATNWHLILSQRSYFAAVGRPSLFRHLWSLAIEGQFYVLWPVVFVFAVARWPTRRLLFATLAAALLSTGVMAALFDPVADPSRIYFGTDTRAAGLLIGAALALVWVPGELKGRGQRVPIDLIGFFALGLLILLNLRLDEFTPVLYRGGFALVAVTTAALIAVAVHPRARLLSAALSWKPLCWVGTRSYGIYLWHWPVFMLTRPQLDVVLGGASLLALRLVLTAVLAELSYRFVETPIRRGALGRSWHALRHANGVQRRRLGIAWLGAVTALVTFFMVLGHSVAIAQPPPPPAYLSVEAINTTLSIEDLPGLESAPALPTAPAASTPTPEIAPETSPASATPTFEITSEPILTATLSPVKVQATPTVHPPSPVPRLTSQSKNQIRQAAPTLSDHLIHVVEPGENLFRIALRYGTTFEAIAMANNIIHPSRIRAGEQLMIPIQTPAAGVASIIPTTTPTVGATLTPVLEAIDEDVSAFVFPTASATPIPPTRTAAPEAPSQPQPAAGVASIIPTTTPTVGATLTPVLEAIDEDVSAFVFPTASATPIPPTRTAAPEAPSHPQPAPTDDDPADSAPIVAARVTAIGDSVMLGAVNQLVHAFGSLDIDAQVSRQVPEAIGILNARRDAGRLSPVVIVHVGNNGIIRHEQVDAMMQALADVQRVVIVNFKVPRRWEGPNNTVLAEKVPQFPNAVLVDWYSASIDRPELFWYDGIHLRPEGAEAMPL